MIFESTSIDLGQTDLLSHDLGPVWDEFKLSLTPENSLRFYSAYNLLTLNQEWSGSVDLHNEMLDEESTLGIEIHHIIIDESIDDSEKTDLIRMLLMNNLIDRLAKIGITLDLEYVTIHTFDLLVGIYDLIFTLDHYEDVMSISDILGTEDLPTVDRYLEVYRKINGLEDTDLEPFFYIIKDVSSQLIKMLLLGIELPDGTPDVDPAILKRIKDNKAFLMDDTLAGKHILNQGRLGMSLTSLRSFYQPELTGLAQHDTLGFVKQLVGFVIISELPNVEIMDTIKDLVKRYVDDLDVLYQAEDLLKRLNLVVEVSDETN